MEYGGAGGVRCLRSEIWSDLVETERRLDLYWMRGGLGFEELGGGGGGRTERVGCLKQAAEAATVEVAEYI